MEGTLRGIEVPEPQTWSPEEPHLHRLKVGYLGGKFWMFFLQAAGLVSEEFLTKIVSSLVCFKRFFLVAFMSHFIRNHKVEVYSYS